MPRVPRLQPQVNPQAAPSVRVSPSAPADAFGGAVPYDAAQKLLSNTESNVVAYQKRTDEVAWAAKQKGDLAVKDDRDLRSSQKVADIETAIKSMQGIHALGAADYAASEWKKHSAEMMEGLTNDTQREYVSRILGAHGAEVYKSAQSHTADEMRKFAAAQHEARKENYQQDSANNPGRSVRNAFILSEAIQEYGVSQGQSQEEIDKKKGVAISDNHAGVVEAMLAGSNPMGAAAYFAKHKEEILPDKRLSLFGHIKEETLVSQASAIAAKLIVDSQPKNPDAKVGGTFDESQIAQGIDKIGDPKLRDEVQKQVNVQIRATEDKFNQNEATLSDLIIKGQLPKVELDKYRGTISNAFYQAASNSIGNVATAKVTPESRDAAATALMVKFGDIARNPDIYARNRGMMDFRRDVLAQSAKLTPENFNAMLAMSDPNFVKQITPEKAPWYASAINYITDHFNQYASQTAPGAALVNFMTKAADQGTKPEEIPTLAKLVVQGGILKENPALVGRSDVSNNTADKKGGVKQVYGGTTNLKADQKITPPEAPPKLGQVVGDHVFMGGNPADPKNWEKR